MGSKRGYDESIGDHTEAHDQLNPTNAKHRRSETFTYRKDMDCPQDIACRKSASKRASKRASKLVHIADEILSSQCSIAEHIASGGESFIQACGRLDSAIKSKQNLPLNTSQGRQWLEAHERKGLPALPPIMDETLQEVPFVHQGSLDAAHSSSVQHSYERLEFLGDAYLEIIASRLIYSRYPDQSAGRLAQIREILVKNETLAEYALGYGFDKRARFPQHIRSTQAKTWTKLMGDIFEAYVAAVVLSSPDHGFSEAEDWLTKLWEPKLASSNIVSDLNSNAKQELAQRVMGKGTRLEYIEEQPAEHNRKEGKTDYCIGVYLTGWGWQKQHLGSGKGNSKGTAGTRAAMSALKNHSLINAIAAVKRDFDTRNEPKEKP